MKTRTILRGAVAVSGTLLLTARRFAEQASALLVVVVLLRASQVRQVASLLAAGYQVSSNPREPPW
jgi:hypothetical protein